MAKLTKESWLKHGLASLQKHGFTSLKADVLAKSLGVSRGSFYHHFDNLAAFHTALLGHWLQVSSLAVVTQLETEQLTPEAKIEALITLVTKGDTRLEQAVRAWAFSDPAVAEIVTRVDRARMAYVTAVLVELGLDRPAAHERATVLYLANVGYMFTAHSLESDEQSNALASIIDYAKTPKK